MSISAYSYNMQSYDSDNRVLIADKGTCSSDGHCIFRSSSTFLGGNYSLYFEKITKAHAFSNSFDFYFSKYILHFLCCMYYQKLLCDVLRFVYK